MIFYKGKKGQSSPGFNCYQMIVIAVSLLVLCLALPLVIAFGYPIVGSYLMFFSGLVLFLFLIEMKQERVEKGFCILMYGLSLQIIYSPLVFNASVLDAMSASERKLLDVFIQIIVLACAGAGGSIIAAHADRSATDNDPVAMVLDKTVIDNTRTINALIANTDNLNRKANWLIGLLVAVLVIGVVCFFALL